MPTFRRVLLLSGILAIAAACASVQEQQALQEWKEEDAKWTADENEAVDPVELAEKASLEDYVLYAMLENPGLRAAFERWKAALEKIEPARTLPDPRFTYAYFIREVETRVGAQQQKFGLMQTFPWFGKLDLRGKIALEAAQSQRQLYEAEKLTLINRVKQIYYEYYYLHRAIEVSESNLQLLTYIEGVARAKYRAGKGGQAPVTKVQVELGKLQDRLDSLRDLLRPVRAKLNLALNRSVDAPLPTPKTPVEGTLGASDEELIAQLKEQNPRLKVLDFMETKEQLAIELAKKNFYPDVSLGVDYVQTDSRTDMNPSDNGKDPIVAILSMNIPIWHRKYYAIRREAEARRRAVVQEREEKENQLTADLEMALYGFRDGERKIDLYRDALIPKARQTMNVTQQAYAVDKASFLDYIDAQRVFLEFQLSYERAVANLAQRESEIEMLTGGPAPSTPNLETER